MRTSAALALVIMMTTGSSAHAADGAGKPTPLVDSNPTVIIISACHSGTFLSIQAPNRTMLTAARKDRKSFGCSIKYQYTFFDECLLKYYGKSKTFEGLFVRANICIKNREQAEEASPPSMPQASIGKQMKNLVIPRKVKPGSEKILTKQKSKS